MKLRIATGRTHQIRVHMKYLNCPILGDSVYAKPDRLFPSATLMLHSKKLSIMLPGNKSRSDFSSPTPQRFLEVLKVLHKKFAKVLLPEDR